MAYCTACGTQQSETAAYCSTCGTPQGAAVHSPASAAAHPRIGVKVAARTDDEVIRRIADYERISGIIWIILAIIQICTIYGIIAGVWNLIAGISRIRFVKAIQQRDSSVPREFEGVVMLVIIGVVNLLLGGIVGVLFVAFDFYIRDQVLSNRHLFEDTAPSLAASG